jgi:hypothetical protein
VTKLFVALGVSVSILGLACEQSPNTATPKAESLEEGEPAPAFVLESPTREVSLADYEGEKPVLLYFSMGPG